MTFFAWLFTVLIIIPTTFWMAMVFFCHVRQTWLRIIAFMVPVVVVGVALATLPIFPWSMAVWGGLFLGTLAWFFSLRPRADRDWLIGMKELSHAEIRDQSLFVRNFRYFSYTENGDPIPRYEERCYDLTKLQSIDYFLSHWAGPLMAHTLVSFGFSDGQYLCVSVEARRAQGQPYSPLRGLFRAYELIFIVGDERDIVRVRTNVRRENVYMYRLLLSSDKLHRLLLDYVKRLGQLADQPEWYNSITCNCTTNLFYDGRANVPLWLKPYIVMNGLSARALYQLGFLDNSLPFEELQRRCAIRERGIAAGDSEDFSNKIRVMPA
jgi:hypothetical protein